MDSITQLVTAPVQPWDALICTSSAVKQNVQFLLEREAEYLAERLGMSRSVLPQLPVIPLGIHTQDFVFGAAERAAARQALAIADDALVVMFMGRLSFHAKAHPLPMYLALEEAARRTDRSVVLMECGWYGNESITQAFSEASAKLCPSVRAITLDGRKSEESAKAWGAADVFCSLSDNIQETFGISPIEAMAVGLPVVVSDWDGYKDTVRHGVDGFRVPTIMPRAGLGGDLALRHALEIDTYDMYIGHACSLTAVDVDATTAAFTALFESKELRRKMGAAGQARASEVYDWARIIPQYEDLWADLNEVRKRASSKKAIASTWPARSDPFAAFVSYPTQLLSEGTELATATPDLEALCARIEDIRGLAMVNFAKLVLPSPEEVRLVLTQAVKGPARAVELVQGTPAERKTHVFRGLAWLLKIGVLRVAALHADRCRTTHSNNKDVTMKTFLHIGCGSKQKERTTAGFNTEAWDELRLDIDERVNPDIVGTMTDMSSVADASVDAIFSSHNIEHLYPHEVSLALAEFRRVLKPEWFVVITCPDLQSVCALVAEDKLTDPAYTSPAGPITPLDILYGHRPAMAKGNLFMAHRCGFTQKVLGGTLQSAGFAKVAIKRRAHPSYDLWAIATNSAMDDAALRALAAEHFPR